MSDLETVGDVMRDVARRAVLRAKALRYVTRTGNADVAEALGLVDAPPEKPKPYVVISGRAHCATCRYRVRSDGICRRAICTAGKPEREERRVR
jgi:hypothetical protein